MDTVTEQPKVAVKAFVAINVTPTAREQLRDAQVTVTTELRRRVSMSDALLIIKALADRHRDEIREIAESALAVEREADGDE